jgi:Domain of unknown function (DUF4259)
MGAWGSGIFEDDTAMDFFDGLYASDKPLQHLKDALEESSTADYLEYGAGQNALVSGAIIDSILNGIRHAEDLDDLDTFIEQHKTLDVAPLKVLASAAVRRVLSEGSELRELWAENTTEFPKWRENLESLAVRLEA